MKTITNDHHCNDKDAKGNNRNKRLNVIYNLLVSGFDYNEIIVNCL